MPWLGNIKDAVFDRCQRRMLMMESVGWYAHQLRDTHPPLVPPLRLHDTNAPFWHSSSALPREKPIEVLYAGQFLGWMDGWMDGKCQLNLHNHNAYETKDTWFFLAMQHTQHWHIFPHIFICYIYKKLPCSLMMQNKRIIHLRVCLCLLLFALFWYLPVSESNIWFSSFSFSMISSQSLFSSVCLGCSVLDCEETEQWAVNQKQ